MSFPSTPPRSVMVVDDSAVQRRHAAELCRQAGVSEIHEAGDGVQALTLLAGMENKPALLILDLEMPTMDGIQLMEKLARAHPEVPVIIASSREPALLNSVRELGVVLGLAVIDVMSKPLQYDVLRAAIGRDVVRQIRRTPVNIVPVSCEELQTAIDSGAIEPHFHPQIDMRNGAVSGFEVLARWRHPVHGMVAPDQFIATAEQYQLIHPLTMRLFESALSQAALWGAAGLKCSLAVNLSPLLFSRRELLQEICQVQERLRVPPERIVLEVTESSVMKDLGMALSMLSSLRLRGFGIACDDYGTGFSSMQQLAMIPFTELKLDRSYVHGAHTRPSAQVLVRSALELATRLELNTVAEGIEHQADWQLLQELGCAVGQGWLVSRPMPAAEVPNWVRQFNERRAEFASEHGPKPRPRRPAAGGKRSSRPRAAR
ncbi:MAG: EAL domain-containing response regulator [Steroidobacteraceae bacterium]